MISEERDRDAAPTSSGSRRSRRLPDRLVADARRRSCAGRRGRWSSGGSRLCGLTHRRPTCAAAAAAAYAGLVFVPGTPARGDHRPGAGADGDAAEPAVIRRWSACFAMPSPSCVADVAATHCRWRRCRLHGGDDVVDGVRPRDMAGRSAGRSGRASAPTGSCSTTAAAGPARRSTGRDASRPELPERAARRRDRARTMPAPRARSAPIAIDVGSAIDDRPGREGSRQDRGTVRRAAPGFAHGKARTCA